MFCFGLLAERLENKKTENSENAEMGKLSLATMMSIALYWIRRRKNRNCSGSNTSKRSKRRIWVRPLLSQENRETFGAGSAILHDAINLNDHFNFMRVTPTQFKELLSMVDPYLKRIDTRRQPISSKIRLAITLRYLASGDSMTSLTYLFRVSLPSISHIIQETTEALWKVLHQKYLPVPNEEDWLRIAEGFKSKWQFPNCIGAVDGKHVVIQAPPNSGSEFYNYKGSHSMVLMAVTDHQYKFVLVDIGAQGRQSDGGIFKDSDIGIKLGNNELNIPQPREIYEEGPVLPFVFVGDEAFPLGEHLLRPYPGRNGLDVPKLIYNYRLSRARRVVENAFGILASRWRIFRKPIIASLKTAENIIKATVCLHNYIFDQKISQNQTIDSDSSEDILFETQNQMTPLGRISSNSSTREAKTIRDKFKEYFNEEGSVPWQWDRL